MWGKPLAGEAGLKGCTPQITSGSCRQVNIALCKVGRTCHTGAVCFRGRCVLDHGSMQMSNRWNMSIHRSFPLCPSPCPYHTFSLPVFSLARGVRLLLLVSPSLPHVSLGFPEPHPLRCSASCCVPSSPHFHGWRPSVQCRIRAGENFPSPNFLLNF